ncbi:MAG TPA: peptidylprolyl isomerase [Ignavibacteriaceae bacterium]|nr:peptidylprolyl isomerase [Ignavibacteriaceae bacterium]
MFLRSIFLLSAGLLFLFTSCSTEHSQIVLAKYGDYDIKMAEFENAYAKNVGSIEKAKEDSLNKKKNFLDLYLNFKMKLRDALVRNYDTDPALLAELTDYKEKVGVTYLLEKKLVEPSVKDLYERRKWEYRASHIMIRTGQGNDEEGKKLANSVFDSIKAGANYEDMAKRYSQDQFSAPVGGDLFYLTAGLLPIEFEDAVYKTEPGQMYPEVLQTKYGYHIIKVTEKRERIPSIQASHILIDFKNEAGELDTVAAQTKADSILTAIRGGEDFSKLASQFSEDPGSKEKGGDLGFFERRMMVKEFDEVAFNLDTNQVSDLVKTNFGFHIIKVTARKPYPSFDEDRENLKKMFERQSYQIRREEFVKNIGTKYNYQLNEETVKNILANSDSTSKLESEHPKFQEFKDKPLFTYAGKTVNAGEYFDKLVDKKDFYKKVVNEDLLRNSVKAVTEDYLLKEEALNLEKTDQSFAELMDDYRNGIFIFKLQEDEVWNKIAIDSSKLNQYYLSTKENYKFPDRVSFVEIFSAKDSVVNSYYAQLQSGVSFDSLVSRTERAGMKEKGGMYALDDVKKSPLYEEANKLEKPGDYSKPVKVQGGYAIIKLVEKDSARLKTFEEARAEVAGAFQESESKRLENEYLENLNKRYEPVVYYSELEKAFVEEK